ncbi:VOC family protein [Levilactobacillus parabrevis]|uniref:VOC family protein n=1 Tax=Levilactobacillus parabrevis TaxID=357278 RepID=UPI0021A8889F|nr:VOC family protein [Levilactobacillus parabrevis]MCT4487522.1 VOC family protein [Levilactobacillus parabrevis]MCT4490653.1 VOC family protein [Levilactobacillus parabrevis]
MDKIAPSLWFADNNCDEAIHYYLTVFPNSSLDAVTYYPDEELDSHFKGMTGRILTAEFHLNGQKFLALDGGPGFRFNEAISFTLPCVDQAEIDYYWAKLSHVPEAEQCGWVKDRFGISWQIVPQNMDELTRTPAQIQAMMQMKKIDIAALVAAK